MTRTTVVTVVVLSVPGLDRSRGSRELMAAAPVTWVSRPAGAVAARWSRSSAITTSPASPAWTVFRLTSPSRARRRRSAATTRARAASRRCRCRDGIPELSRGLVTRDPGGCLLDVRAVRDGQAVVARERDRRGARRGGPGKCRLERVVRLHRLGVGGQERRLVGHPLAGQRRREADRPRRPRRSRPGRSGTGIGRSGSPVARTSRSPTWLDQSASTGASPSEDCL